MSTNNENIMSVTELTVDMLEKLGSKSGIVLSSTLPNIISGRVLAVELRTKDRAGRPRQQIAITIELLEPQEHKGRTTVTTIPKSGWLELAKFMKQHGLQKITDLEDKIVVFEKKQVGRAVIPRYIPVKLIEPNKQ